MDCCRRSLLQAGLAGAALGAGPAAFAFAPARPGGGCWLSAEEAGRLMNASEPIVAYQTGDEAIIPKSGNRAFDRALAESLARLSKVYGVLPGFGYFDDSDSMNAYATPRVRMGRMDGTVLFGTTLLQYLMKRKEAPDAAILAVCAHEYGHIVQYKYGLRDRLLAGQTSVKRLELHADFLAGYFAGLRKRERPTFPAAVFAFTQDTFGDTAFGSRDHHGTSIERGKAVEAGFFASKMSFADAVEQGVTYVLST